MRTYAAKRWRSVGTGSYCCLNLMQLEFDTYHGSDKYRGKEDPTR